MYHMGRTHEKCQEGGKKLINGWESHDGVVPTPVNPVEDEDPVVSEGSRYY